MNICKNCIFWKSDKLDLSPVAGKCVKLETITGNLFGCVHWQSAQQNMHWTAGIPRRFKHFSVVKFVLSLWHSLASRQ